MKDEACLDALDDTALDHLPFGVIRLGPTGRVERYNRTEAERAGMQRWRVIGRDFYREVVGVEGAALAAEVAAVQIGQSVRVHHRLRRYRKTEEVTIEVARTREGGAYLCIVADVKAS
ncbi:MAG: PAS domain-containing protein [Kofleriaceae bacterium]